MVAAQRDGAVERRDADTDSIGVLRQRLNDARGVDAARKHGCDENGERGANHGFAGTAGAGPTVIVTPADASAALAWR